MQRSYESLIKEAKIAAQNAHAPYSKFKVGACALFESGNIYTGCNVENSSYGLSLCAERNALSSAVSAGEKSKLIAIAIVSPNMKFCTPCGACRQWITEFSKDAKVILEKDDSSLTIIDIKELLPYTFEL
ncbi:MAG: cytidine deaminase [bacterium]|nr:cytidine deaminase [bacterium]